MRLRRFPSGLGKTLSFAVIHLAIAVTIGWLVTGAFVLAGALALVEPAVNTFAAHFLDKLRFTRGSARRQRVLKSALLAASHLIAATGVGLLLGGSWIAATAYAVLEPLANAVAHYFFDRWWERPASRPQPEPAFI
jgi:uncharacterized membrane protein